ncbi:MAG: branched-chain amino acid transporter ATPase/permease [Subtercola sp.]|nr:branched-chain amino acid transporter ATPase/permease [Subtercola sp.]
MLASLLPFLVTGLVTGSVLGLAGTGLVLTYKTSGIFNIGYGAVAAASAYIFYYLNQELKLPWWLCLIIAVGVIGPAFGILLSWMSRALSQQRVALKIVATVGLILIVQGLATIVFGPNPLRQPNWLPGGTTLIRLGGVNVTVLQLVIVGFSLLVVIALYVFFRASRTGLAMRAIVSDPDLLSLHGTNPVAIRRLAWTIGSTFAALSGVLIAPTTGIEAVAMTFIFVQAFGAAAIGGFSNMPLTYLGGLVIGVAVSFSTKIVVDVPGLAGLSSALPFVVLVIALLVIPKRRLETPGGLEKAPRRPWHGPALSRIVVGVILLAAFIAVPFLFHDRLSYFTVGLTQAILLLSLGLLIRTAGLVSLGQAAFAAIGAVAFSQFTVNLGIPWLPAVLLGALVVVPIAAILALPAIRLSGLFLALATLGFGLVLEQMFYPRDYFFGSSSGGRPMPRPPGFESDTSFYFVVLAFFIAVSLVMVIIHRGRIGRMLQGLSESPMAVRTLGLNANLTRLIVICIAGYIAGIAGILYGSAVNFAVLGDPDYSAYYSLILVATLALMPFREPWYAVVAVISAVIPAYWLNTNATSWLNVLFGVAAVVTAMQGGPGSVGPRLRAWVTKYFGRTRAAVVRKAPVSAPWSLSERATGLEVSGLTIRYGGRTAVDGVSFSAPVGQITGLIGPNGAGKTTTFNATSGLLKPSSGTITLNGDDVTSMNAAARGRRGLGRTFQLMQLADSLTVEQNVALGVESGLAGSSVRGQLFASPAEARMTRDAAEYAMELCGIADLRDRSAGELSTGQRRLVELARCLAGPFDTLLLDEPSSGLDTLESEQLGETLLRVVQTRGCGILLVEHDMALVLKVCAEIYVLDFGELLFHGTPDEIRTSPLVQAAYLGSSAGGMSEVEEGVTV